MNVRKKAGILLSTYLLTFYLYKKDSENTYVLNDDYTCEEVTPYAFYKDKNIYIDNKINTIKNIDKDKNGIYIIDERDDEDPNVRICNSYKITKLKDMKEILEMLQEYEKNNPSNWDRTTTSMFIEWLLHNFSYYVSYCETSSRSVDLNNEDEDIAWLIKRTK